MLVTSKLVVYGAWLPLTRELLSVSETEGENNITQDIFYAFSLPPSFCFAKIHFSLRLGHLTALTVRRTVIHSRSALRYPRQREAGMLTLLVFVILLNYFVHRLTYFEPRHHGVVFIIQKDFPLF